MVLILHGILTTGFEQVITGKRTLGLKLKFNP